MSPPVTIAQLESLNNCIIHRPPYLSGKLGLTDDKLRIYYGKDDAHRLDFTTATKEDLEHLARTCDAAAFGLNAKDVLDESYRKAGGLDAAHFATTFELEGTGLLGEIRNHFLSGELEKVQRPIWAQRYKLNVYGEGGFFKAHKDTPRGSNMFASLVLVFPTNHEGGQLIVRDGQSQWTIDSAAETKDSGDQRNVVYIAFFSDVEHEIEPVTPGYRVTVTYNFYFEPIVGIERTVFADGYNELLNTFKTPLADSSFLPGGGFLGFGLRREYPIDLRKEGPGSTLNDLYLTGGDVVFMQACKDLGLKSTLNLWFEAEEGSEDLIGVICPSIPPDGDSESEDYLQDLIRYQGARGVVSYSDNPKPQRTRIDDDHFGYFGRDQPELLSDIVVYWVTKLTKYTQLKNSYVGYGSEATLEHIYGSVCLIVELGPYNKRQASALGVTTSTVMSATQPALDSDSDVENEDEDEDEDEDDL